MKIKGKITAVSGPREHEGKLQVGFVIDSKWYNVVGEKEALEEIKKLQLIKGNEVEFDLDNGLPKNLKVLKEASKDEKKWEDDIVSFETLLTKAHNLKKSFSIKTEMLQLDLEKKFALFKAKVIVEVDSEHDMVFEGHGDSTSENVTGDFIKPHFIRMAETRAICRALRWYTNNGCAEEEK